LIDIESDSILKLKFPTIPLSSIWVSLTEEYPEISKRAVRKLLPFPANCLCVNLEFRDRVKQKQHTETSWKLRQAHTATVAHYTRFQIDMFIKSASSVTQRNLNTIICTVLLI
jgi:hypothetical protein